jgi:hypothetical protein
MRRNPSAGEQHRPRGAGLHIEQELCLGLGDLARLQLKFDRGDRAGNLRALDVDVATDSRRPPREDGKARIEHLLCEHFGVDGHSAPLVVRSSLSPTLRYLESDDPLEVGLDRRQSQVGDGLRQTSLLAHRVELPEAVEIAL